MKDLRQLLRELSTPVRILLFAAAARAVSFFALLVYLPIYLHEAHSMGGAQIGYVVGLSMLVGTLASVYGGYLADRFVKVHFVIVLDVILTALYVAVPLVDVSAVVVVFLFAANIASSSMSVTGNALLSELVRPDIRTKVFSLRYSLQNIGAVVGPFLGAWLARAHTSGPFLMAAGFILAALVPLAAYRRTFLNGPQPQGDPRTAPAATEQAAADDAADDTEPLGFGQVLRVMRGDRRLALFTLGGILSIMVYGPLLTYMSQYLVLVQPREEAYQSVAYISAANAVVVIALQYALGSRLRDKTLLKWLTLGCAAFIAGLIGLSVSTHALVLVLAIAVFTVGEVIVVPAEYMFIDNIAPAKLRGSYFGAQNLIHLGIAFGPIVCGFLLEHSTPAVMFATLIALTVASWWFYVLGTRAAAVGAATAAPHPDKAQVK
ncbi:MFS transporter [Streptomyces monticola]|uniref:MFS transporter n=1 Tax=Streptomyces monticola TaxID=2666263 RepID=A0ABW2JYS4_9ACTN